MDRNSVVGIIIIAVILIGYSVLMKPSTRGNGSPEEKG